jgi:hypothetical protein
VALSTIKQKQTNSTLNNLNPSATQPSGQGSQNVPATDDFSSFTFTFSPVKKLSSMGFPTIFMFM